MNYSTIIKKIRNRLFLTQTELAKMLGVTVTSVCRWEKNIFEPTIKIKKKIAEICMNNNIEME